MSAPDLAWRPMTPDDLDAVCAVAAVAFPHHPEDRAVFAERLSLHPAGCFALAPPKGAAVGYLVAYPYALDAVPPLNAVLGSLPPEAATMYLHDLALAPSARGRGLTGGVVERLASDARGRGFRAVALVAVNDAVGFWRRHGFTVRETPELAARLAGYGPDARYMVRRL